MPELQTPEWVKESIIRGLNRPEPGFKNMQDFLDSLPEDKRNGKDASAAYMDYAINYNMCVFEISQGLEYIKLYFKSLLKYPLIRSWRAPE